MDFYQEEQTLPLSSALFYEKLETYLIKGLDDETAYVNIDSLIEMFCVSLLYFLNKDILEIDLYMSCFDGEQNNQENIENMNPDLLRLSRFILEKGSKYFINDKYSLDLSKHNTDSELLDILSSLGVCDYLWKFYKDVEEIVKKVEASNYNIRLDKYIYDPVKCVYTSEK